MPSPSTPKGVLASVAFFTGSGLLELGLGLVEAPKPLAFWPVWEILGRALLYWLLAAGLFHRLALCRRIALVYCLSAVTMYGAILVLALLHAPLAFPLSVIVSSLFQVPSCALIFPYLRSPEALVVFPRPLIGR